MLGPENSPGGEFAAEVVFALLQVDHGLSQSDHVLRRAIQSPAIRQALAEHIVQPYIRRHRLSVDFDQQRQQLLDSTTRHPAVSAERFFIERRGVQDVLVDEIYLGRSLSTAQHLRVIDLLGRRRPCLAVATTALDTVLLDATYPLIGHCGQRRANLTPTQELPVLLQVDAKRQPTSCRLDTRWCRRFRILTEADI